MKEFTVIAVCAAIAVLVAAFAETLGKRAASPDSVERRDNVAHGTGWFSGVTSIWVADASGQVYELEQVETNSNLYAVFLVTGATNGIPRR